MGKKVLVIGLDCAPPELVFDRFLDDLPNIRLLIQNGAHGPLNSTIPPITVPAWMSLATSKDPGTLGFYGLRNRADYSYNRMEIANSRLVKDDTLWDILSAHEKKVILIGIPQTYPPRPVNGCQIASFLTPDNTSAYTYPNSLKEEIDQVADGYIIDVRDFRTTNKKQLLQQIHEMTKKRFKVARHLLQTRDWDFGMLVEMGTDRIHHGFWRFLDPTHRKYDPNSEFKNAIRDYYRELDNEIGTLINLVGPETAILLVSDHGAKRIDGGICVNEWLMQEGYLKLHTYPQSITPFESLDVDWANTKAWGAGGYYARIFLNVAGREPQGIIPQDQYQHIRNELAEKLRQMPIPNRQEASYQTQVFRPEDVYQTVNNIPPDLIVYFDDLLWRSVGSMGHNAIYTLENDTGPDDANHAQHGIFILADGPHANPQQSRDIRDIAPTVLSLMNVPIPEDMQGRSIIDTSSEWITSETTQATQSDQVYTEEEKKAVEARLKALGYL